MAKLGKRVARTSKGNPATAKVYNPELSLRAAQHKTKPVVLSGQELTIDELVAVVRSKRPVLLNPDVKPRVDASRSALDGMLKEGELIYGVNTGFGGNVRFGVLPESINEHQQNLLRFLCCGTGAPLSAEVTRAAMVLRVNALCNGFSAIRFSVLQSLCDLLNHDITPIVPRYGSVGASGDLIPSAYIGRTLLGEGEVMYGGRRSPAVEALRDAGISVTTLKAKEGLALVNGTSVMTGIAALAIHSTEYLAEVCVGVVGMTIEALRSTISPFDETIQKVKGHPGQVKVARMLRHFTRGSSSIVDIDSVRERLRATHGRSDSRRGTRTGGGTAAGARELEESIQPAYSLRCAPQGLGVVFDCVQATKVAVEREMNSVNDNPLISHTDGRVYHTGNFYGGHIARGMDALKLDLCILANWLHALMAMIVDQRFNNGLPPNLSSNPSAVTGFKGMQLSLTSLTCACRQIAAPSSIHTLPTEQYNQDIVSLGLHSAATALEMTELVCNAAAIAVIALCQSLDLRKSKNSDMRLGRLTECIYHRVRKEVAYLEADCAMDGDICCVAGMIRERLLLAS